MTGNGADPFLLVRVRGQLCALPLAHVEEVMRPLPVRPVPGAPSFVTGVAVIRGRVMPVIDAAAVLGHAASQPARFVSLKLEARRVALAVDATIGIRELPAAAGVDLPPLVRDIEATVVRELRMLDNELLIVLGASRLVPDQVWSALEANESQA